MAEVVAVCVPELAVLDVVFLHGLDGDARKTWTAKAPSSFWPAWLAEDFDGVAVWSVSYDAWSTGWRGRAMPMQDRAVNLMAQLQNRGIGQRPLCFVTHSMGGLLAKEILLHAAEGRNDYAAFATAARGVVFLGTPHTGSSLTRFVEALGRVYRATAAVKDLKRNSAYLRHLNDRYRDWADKSGIRNLVFFEAYPTKGVRVVDEVSANPGLPRVPSIPVDANHIDICKPADRDSLVYGQVQQFLNDILRTVVDHASTIVPTSDAEPPVRSVRKLPADTGLFVGRTDELAELEKATAASDRVVVAAVHGLGGVGKSTLVARFATMHADRFLPIWWVTADSVAAIDNGLADLAVALTPETVELPLEQRAEQAVAWLSRHNGWLLVLDNLSAPADAARLLERVHTGTIIITSRQSTGWRGLTTVPLDVLARGEALDLLTRIVRAEWPEADLTAGERLCAELGWLPLAVEQAAAYIAQTRITPGRYLDLLAQFPARMFAATAEGGDAQRTMARVWRVTLDRLTATPAAGQLLRVLAWYASDDILRDIVISVFAEPELLDAVGRLAAYSMITLTTDTISVHRLVQAVARTPDQTDPHRHPDDITTACAAATIALVRAVDELDHRTPSSWPTYQSIHSHARALFEHTTTPDTDTEAMCLLLTRMGVYVDSQGDGTTAIAYLTRAAQGLEHLHGRDHWTTLDAHINLANAYWAMGDLGRTIPLIETTLADSLRAYGPDDKSTQVLRNNLANAYKSAGHLDRAIRLLEETVNDRTRLWGSDHPDTLTARNNLANAYHDDEQFLRAIEMHTSVVADRNRTLGPDHPATLNSRHNLAHGYQAMGDVEKAMSLYESIIADRTRVLGPHHKNTLDSKLNLANTYKSMGDLVRATRLHKSTLHDYVRTLGVDHPKTLNAQISLADTYRRAGNLVRAIRLYKSTAADHVRVLGPDHPDTLKLQTSLADTYKAKGDLKQAIQLYESTAINSARVLGADHPDTLNVRSNLADAYVSTGDLERAIPLSESVVSDCARVLGSEHEGTLTTQNNLAHAYAAAGDRKRAISLLQSVAADCVRVLGPDHPTTTAVHTNLEAVTRY